MTDATWDAGKEVLIVGDAHWKLWSVPTDAVWSTPSIGRSIGCEIPDSDGHREARLVRALRDALVERDRLRASEPEAARRRWEASCHDGDSWPEWAWKTIKTAERKRDEAWCQVRTAERERDELRAEVERLTNRNFAARKDEGGGA